MLALILGNKVSKLGSLLIWREMGPHDWCVSGGGLLGNAIEDGGV